MAGKLKNQEFVCYDYLSSEEAAYQGYDMVDESDIGYGFSIIESTCENEDDSDYGDDESEAADDSDYGDDESEAEDDSDYGDDESEAEDDENFADDGESDESSELYTPDSRDYKDPRQFILALYRKDISRHPQLTGDEQIALAYAVRRGLLCECSMKSNKSNDQGEHDANLVDNADVMLLRLQQTEEEAAWVGGLNDVERLSVIAEGRVAREQLISCNLPLVMASAQKEHNQMEYLDRIQAGNEGLIKAVQYFNPHKGNRFSTFATYLIQHEIRDCAKKMKMQKAGAKIWENHTPTEADIDAVCDLMGGRYWMQEIMVDSEQTEDRIRKQIAVLLERKTYMESAANDILSGFPDDYDRVLADAEGIDVVKGDETLPKNDELSIEDFVRSFFRAVIEAKTVSHDKLALFVLLGKDAIQQKAGYLEKFQDKAWEYTDETAIDELWQLIGVGVLWPERPLIKLMRSWSGKETETKNDSPTDYSEYIDSEHPTEAEALILQDGYVALRHRDIMEDVRITLDYCDWISEIIWLTIEERLDEIGGNMLEDLAKDTKYAKIQEAYDISPNTVKKRKDEILRSIYDQIIENTNKENGEMYLKYLTQRYQAWVFKSWEKRMIARMVHDHFIDKKRFVLRSRGEADSPRPFMETIHKLVTRVSECCDQAVSVLRASNMSETLNSIVDISRRIEASLGVTAQSVKALLSSEAYERWVQEWSEDGNMDEMDDDLDLDINGKPDTDEGAFDTHKEFINEPAAKAV